MDEDFIIILAIVVVGIALYMWLQPKLTESGLLKDESVDTNIVVEALDKFSLIPVEGRKNGFTENDVEKQLEAYLKNTFEHVTRQHGIAGTNAKRIDLDIGRGAVGIEIKLATDIIKEIGNDRLIGQVVKYSDRKNSKEHRIIVVAGLQHHQRETAYSDLKDFLSTQKVKCIFISPVKLVNEKAVLV